MDEISLATQEPATAQQRGISPSAGELWEELCFEADRVAAREEILRGFLDVAVLRPTNFALGLGSLLAPKLGELSMPVERLGALVLTAMADEPAIVDGKHFGHAALQEMRKILAPASPQPMANTMPLERVEALIVEKWGQIALCRRITRSNSNEIGRCRGDDRRLVSHGGEHEISKPLDRHGELPKLSGQQ